MAPLAPPSSTPLVAPMFDKFHRVASRPRIRAAFKEAACRYGRQPVEDLERFYNVRTVPSFLQRPNSE